MENEKNKNLVFGINDMINFASQYIYENCDINITKKDVEHFVKMRDRQKALEEFLKEYDKQNNIKI